MHRPDSYKTTLRLQMAFRDVMRNPLSRFYTDLYASKGFVPPDGFPKNLKEWGDLPFLSNDDFQAPLMARTHVPWEDLYYIGVTSGTSGKKLTLTPHALRDKVMELSWWPTRYMRQYMNFSLMTSGVDLKIPGVARINGHHKDLRLSAALAARYEVEGLYLTPSLLLSFLPHLKEVMPLERIRVLLFFGEPMSSGQYSFIRETFPHARLFGEYGINQTGVLGFSCETLWMYGPNLIHFLTDKCYSELVEIGGARVIEGEEAGELVVTRFDTKVGMPVLRLRTGDGARRVKTPCECDAETFELFGRVEQDYVPIPGGRIWRVELERVMRAYWNEIGDAYQLRVGESVKNGHPRLQLTLTVSPLHPGFDFEHCAQEVSKSLRVSAEHSLADFVSQGVVEPLSCVPAERSESSLEQKRLRIIRA